MNFFPPMDVSSSPLPNLQCKSFFARYKATRAKLRKEAASGHEVIDPNTVMQAADNNTDFTQEDEDAVLEAIQGEHLKRMWARPCSRAEFGYPWVG